MGQNREPQSPKKKRQSNKINIEHFINNLNFKNGLINEIQTYIEKLEKEVHELSEAKYHKNAAP